jgi:FkbM family methyltransferase
MRVIVDDHDFHKMLHALKTPLKRLLYTGSLTASQAGQDYWVYAEAFNEKKYGFFLDIGAHDGITLSNSYILESRYKWTGICIEANPVTFKDLRKNRRATCLNTCLDRTEGEVNFILANAFGGIVDEDVDNKVAKAAKREVIKLQTATLNSLLEAQHAPEIIDYLSIDVEGAEERILAEFDFGKYTFRCITIERPTALLRDLFKEHGYILIKEIEELDCFYIHQSFLKDYGKNLLNFYRKKCLTFRWR